VSPDVWQLIDRDHAVIETALRVLADPTSRVEDLTTELDGVRIGFAVHAIAQHRILRTTLERMTVPTSLQFLVAQSAATHRVQESAVWALAYATLGTAAMRGRARDLRMVMARDADREAACLRPALLDYLPRAAYLELAPGYATQRLRLFGEVEHHHRLGEMPGARQVRET
jgi:hypothetical protein